MRLLFISQRLTLAKPYAVQVSAAPTTHVALQMLEELSNIGIFAFRHTLIHRASGVVSPLRETMSLFNVDHYAAFNAKALETNELTLTCKGMSSVVQVAQIERGGVIACPGPVRSALNCLFILTSHENLKGYF